MSDAPVRAYPLLLVKPKTVSRADIRRAERLGHICIVECLEPEAARYSDPPIHANIDAQARAALSLLRMVLRQPSPDFRRGDLTRFYIDALMNESPPTKTAVVPAVKK